MKTEFDQRDQTEIVAQAIFEAIADPIFVIDFVGDDLADTFRYVNEAACHLLQRSREELLKMRPGTVDEIPRSVMEEAYDRLLTEGKATFETLMIAKDGTRIPMEIHASDACLDGRRVCIAVARSLVVRKEIDRRLREARDAAEAANRAKSEFLATMSHEIRTPLHGVIGFSSLLETSEDPERVRETLDGLRSSANLLLTLVNDVLDLSRIEAGLLELRPATLDLTAQLKRIVAAFRLRAEEKGLVFSYVENATLPPFVLADALRIEQVLGNLLGNALKFTERGSIVLTVDARPLEGAESELSFSVTDTGIGIRPEDVALLFNRFSQVDASPSRRYGGSGLGLVIVKRLCELMGGTAAVSSEYGRGSTFTASLQVISVEEEVSAPPVDPSSPVLEAPRQLRILVAEDNRINQRLMTRMFERLGYAATFTDNGEAVSSEFRRAPYDLIFMDVGMPRVSGLEATRAIRAYEQEKGCPATWIVALTAGVSEDERKACAEAGMDDFLGKPFTEESLRAAIRRAGKSS